MATAALETKETRNISNARKIKRVNESGLRTVFCDWSQELLKCAKMTSLHVQGSGIKGKAFPTSDII